MDHHPDAASTKLERIAHHYKHILQLLDQDVTSEHLKDTPMRAAKSMMYLTSGCHEHIQEKVKNAVYHNSNKDYSYASGHEWIHLKDLSVHSVCEHHLMPFYGKASITYVPGDKIVGLSKFSRIISVLSRRLQEQERLTREVTMAIVEALKPRHITVTIEAVHTCMLIRGVHEAQAKTLTNFSYGMKQPIDRPITFIPDQEPPAHYHSTHSIA